MEQSSLEHLHISDPGLGQDVSHAYRVVDVRSTFWVFSLLVLVFYGSKV